jgi:hypothetical protein
MGLGFFMLLRKGFKQLIYRMWGINFLLISFILTLYTYCPHKDTYNLMSYINPYIYRFKSDPERQVEFYQVMFRLVLWHQNILRRTDIWYLMQNLITTIIFVDIYLVT